jgi:hypothetical protein
MRGVLPTLEAVRKSGAMSLAEIASALNERGVRSASGGRWHRSSVRNLLTSRTPKRIGSSFCSA